MHGYELRKRLTGVLGAFHSISYGSLYPALKDLTARGWLAEGPGDHDTSGRSRVVYQLTADGKEHLQALLAEAGPDAWDDERFGVRLAFFGRTDQTVRLRVLEGRRSRLEERLDTLRASLQRGRERMDAYTLELQQHGLDSVEREVRWLDELIATERSHDLDSQAPSGPRAAQTSGNGTVPSNRRK